MQMGIVYVATGKKYFDEACISASSVKRWMPNLRITIFTDQKGTSPCFDQITLIQSYGDGFKDKVIFMSQSPYDQTLFLDTDTFLCESIWEIFGLLDHFDMAIAHDHLVREVYPMEGVPGCYPEFNSGVLLFRKSPDTASFFDDWLHRFEEDKRRNGRGGNHPDQPSLRQASYFSSLRIATLTPEYNCMFRYAGSVTGRVKVLHCARIGYGWYKRENMVRVARIINMSDKARVFICGRAYAFLRSRKTRFSAWNVFAASYTMKFLGYLFPPEWVRRIQRIPRALRERGVLAVGLLALKRLLGIGGTQ